MSFSIKHSRHVSCFEFLLSEMINNYRLKTSTTHSISITHSQGYRQNCITAKWTIKMFIFYTIVCIIIFYYYIYYDETWDIAAWLKLINNQHFLCSTQYSAIINATVGSEIHRKMLVLMLEFCPARSVISFNKSSVIKNKRKKIWGIIEMAIMAIHWQLTQ